MRFSLQDVKKTVQRRGGSLAVSLHFLRGSELEPEINRLIAYHETSLGKPQHAFSLDEARSLIGDYRLAYCLLATLSHWYHWRNLDWQETTSALDSSVFTSFPTPLDLRQALYSFVNENYHGFLLSSHRTEALTRFAALHALSLSQLESLLILDSEEEALLLRVSPQPPTPQAVATLYNQWTFEIALSNSSSVHFVLDPQAFLASQSLASQSPFSPTTGLGAAIKRLCFLARKLGVYYDLAYEESLQSLSPLLHLTLYGPQDVTGAPQQYGLRLARLCRLLLGYDLRSNQRSKGRKSLGSAITQAEATVHFLQRSYTFIMDTHLLSLLPSHEEENPSPPSQDDLYDSSVEQYFAEAFLSLARDQGTDGWQLEREPEPLLLPQAIAIPDFALSRGSQRVYVEILGFWTPSYRERKIQKLLQLRTRTDLLLIIPEVARTAFTSIADSFPILYYDQQISLADLLQTLRTHYDDFTQRLSEIDLPTITSLIYETGFLAEQACYPLLHCYRRSELQEAAHLVTNQEISFLPGLGLFTRSWMLQLQRDALASLSDGSAQSLDALCTTLKSLHSSLQSCPTPSLELLIAQWPEISIERASIFEARVFLKHSVHAEEPTTDGNFEAAPEKEPKRPLKERRTTRKKRIEYSEQSIAQENLWGV